SRSSARIAGNAVASPAPTSTTAAPIAVAEPSSDALWPQPSEGEKHTPEHDLFLRHAPEERSVEIGASGFLMNSGDVGYAGPSIFAMIELGGGLFLRPRALVGRSAG